MISILFDHFFSKTLVVEIAVCEKRIQDYVGRFYLIFNEFVYGFSGEFFLGRILHQIVIIIESGRVGREDFVHPYDFIDQIASALIIL